jgi:hypothetical protein
VDRDQIKELRRREQEKITNLMKLGLILFKNKE